MAKTFNNTRLQQFGQGLMNKVKDSVPRKYHGHLYNFHSTALYYPEDLFVIPFHLGIYEDPYMNNVNVGDVVWFDNGSILVDNEYIPAGSLIFDAFDNYVDVIWYGRIMFNGKIYHFKVGSDRDVYITGVEALKSDLDDYAKKEDVGRRLTATLSDMSRINDFSGNLNAVGGVNLILSDSSVTPRPGDLIEVTASNGTSIGFQIMASPNAGFFKCMALHINSMNPYIVMLVKTSTGVFSIEAHRVLTATSDNTKTLTQAQYDALTTKDPNTTYFITE